MNFQYMRSCNRRHICAVAVHSLSYVPIRHFHIYFSIFSLVYPAMIKRTPVKNGMIMCNDRSLSNISPIINPIKMGMDTKKPPVFSNFQPNPRPINIRGKIVN